MELFSFPALCRSVCLASLHLHRRHPRGRSWWRLPPRDDRCSSALPCCRLRARDNLSDSTCGHRHRGRTRTRRSWPESPKQAAALEGVKVARTRYSEPLHQCKWSGTFSASCWRALEGVTPLTRCPCTFSRASELYARLQHQYAAASLSTSASMQASRTLSSLQIPVPSMLI